MLPLSFFFFSFRHACKRIYVANDQATVNERPTTEGTGIERRRREGNAALYAHVSFASATATCCTREFSLKNKQQNAMAPRHGLTRVYNVVELLALLYTPTVFPFFLPFFSLSLSFSQKKKLMLATRSLATVCVCVMRFVAHST